MFSRADSRSSAIEASEADAQQRYEEICELLVAAGYFRARLGALSPFDKVVGGMAWCMTATSVDVDIAFQENANIGQKIKIGEGIERALRQMKCRIPLQAHQIQGLDYAAIFPVVQWLVKQAYEFREEIADATRRLSASNFDRHFELPSDASLAARRRVALPASRQLCDAYLPTRRFRPKHGAARAATRPAVHARRVLMEFGTQLPVVAAHDAADDGKDASAAADNRAKAAAAAAAAAAEAAEAAEAADAADAAGEMAETDQDAELNQSRIGKLVKMGATDIQQAALEFARKSEALAASGEMAAAHKLRAEREGAAKQLEVAQRQLAKATERAARAAAARDAADAAKAAAHGALDRCAQDRAAAEAEMASLEEAAQGADQAELAKLQALLALAERLGGQKGQFKRECAAQLEAMNAELARLRAANEGADADGEARQLAEIERLHDAEDSKAGAMRRLVGQKGREIATLTRQVDDVPSSAELMQYERRFRELYSQVAAKLDETRRYYALFNTLEEKKGYLAKEVSLLNSLHENFNKASTTGAKEKIVESVEGILKSVVQSLDKVAERLHDATAARDATQQKYDRLAEQQRKYYALVKAYQAEMAKNEKLAAA